MAARGVAAFKSHRNFERGIALLRLLSGSHDRPGALIAFISKTR